MKWTFVNEIRCLDAWECVNFTQNDSRRCMICRAFKNHITTRILDVWAVIVDIDTPRDIHKTTVSTDFLLRDELGIDELTHGSIISGPFDLGRDISNEEWQQIREDPTPWITEMILGSRPS